MNPMIQLQKVDKIYRTEEIETVALENVNLEVSPNTIQPHVGPLLGFAGE